MTKDRAKILRKLNKMSEKNMSKESNEPALFINSVINCSIISVATV